MKTSEDLKQILERIDHRGYPAYKDTRGVYQFGTYILGIDHVQEIRLQHRQVTYTGGRKSSTDSERTI